MRNCFVANCDAFCKKNGILKRMMFSAPKDNFENWKSKLFNKREFRETDRVCERHFDKSQILTHWEHIIDGKLCQLEREKPKIKSDAVPYLNLPESESANANKTRNVKTKPEPKRRKQIHPSSDHKEKPEVHFDADDVVMTFDVKDDEVASPTKRNGRAETPVEDVQMDEEKRLIFDSVYDDIYEVVLPNTLWGIHRDPEDRRFIAFTLFDAKKMSSSISVKITDTFNLKVHVNGVEATNETLGDLSVDILTKLLNQLSDSGCV